MKNNILVTIRNLTVIVISFLTSSSLVMAAIFDLEKSPQSSFASPDQILLFNNESEASFPNQKALQQESASSRKDDYIEIFNLLKKIKLEEARSKISLLLIQSPDQPEFYNLQAMLEIMEKNITSAQQSYQKAIDLDKNNIFAHLGLARLAIENEQLDKAKDYANKVLTIDDKSIHAYLLLADIAYKQKNNTEVEDVLLTAQKKVKGNITSEIQVAKNLGKFYVIQKQPAKILSLSQDIAERYPNDNMALSVLAEAQLINRQKQLAEQTLLKLVNQDKRDINHRLLLAQLLTEHVNKEKDVLKLLDEALAIDPNKPQTLGFKTAYLTILKRYQEALENAKKIDQLFPTLALGKILKGDVYLAEKNLDKALDSYQQAYRVKPNEKILSAIVDLMNAQGNLPEAIGFLNSELEKNPKNNAIHFKLATVYQQQKDYKQADKHYKAILTEHSDNIIALNNLAWIYWQQNNPQAIELAKKAYDQAPKSAVIADTYGYILVKQGQRREGLAVLKKAATSAPKVNTIQFHLAEAHAANGNKTQAIEILESIIKAERNFPEKKEAISLLDKLKAY